MKTPLYSVPGIFPIRHAANYSFSISISEDSEGFYFILYIAVKPNKVIF